MLHRKKVKSKESTLVPCTMSFSEHKYVFQLLVIFFKYKPENEADDRLSIWLKK